VTDGITVVTPDDNFEMGMDDLRPQVFLGGGITGCPDWQRVAAYRLNDMGANAILFNPRRAVWPGVGSDGPETREQIAWEVAKFRRSNVVSFWFPQETLCPITLMELGFQLAGRGVLVVGCHRDYQRRFDVESQVEEYRPDLTVAVGFDEYLTKLKGEIDGFVGYF
jgi:hypothetical protein